jgi:hypothetical protein
MGIPESQLTTWSNQGATTSSASTYASIKAALAAHKWPKDWTHVPYLQGSYANTTNIRGNSDVDVVAEMTSMFFSDLTEEQKQQRNLGRTGVTYDDFRREIVAALTSYYGSANIDATGPNAITVKGDGSRLKADVLAAVRYQEYRHGYHPVYGIKFWNQQTNQEKINFPKLHIDNGEAKNQNGTNQRYKPSVRMIKNARERVIGSDDNLRKKYPSYFVECLIYNVPDNQFTTSRQDTFVNILNFLHKALRDDRGQKFVTQSKQRYLFGNDSTQWSIANATAFVDDLVKLWNNGV